MFKTISSSQKKVGNSFSKKPGLNIGLRLFILTLFIFGVTLLTTLFLLVSARASPSTSCRTDTHITSTDTLPHSLIIYST